jgi:hypothetical protein
VRWGRGSTRGACAGWVGRAAAGSGWLVPACAAACQNCRALSEHAAEIDSREVRACWWGRAPSTDGSRGQARWLAGTPTSFSTGSGVITIDLNDTDVSYVLSDALGQLAARARRDPTVRVMPPPAPMTSTAGPPPPSASSSASTGHRAGTLLAQAGARVTRPSRPAPPRVQPLHSVPARNRHGPHRGQGLQQPSGVQLEHPVLVAAT